MMWFGKRNRSFHVSPLTILPRARTKRANRETPLPFVLKGLELVQVQSIIHLHLHTKAAANLQIMPASEPIPNTSPLLPPTHPLTTQAARLYTHVHPVLVLGLLATSFNAIVANPVSTLHALAYPLAALQAAYCVICLPAAKNEATKPRKAGQSSSSSSSLKQTLSSRITVSHRGPPPPPTEQRKPFEATNPLTAQNPPLNSQQSSPSSSR